MVLICPGELITCEEGHVVAEVLTAEIDNSGAVRAGLWRRGTRVSDGECVCGARFWRPGAWHVNDRGWVEVLKPGGLSPRIAGGQWRPARPDLTSPQGRLTSIERKPSI
jgi:hypothetical protein